MSLKTDHLNPGNPQDVMDELDGDLSPADLIKMQSELQLMMMKYTAISQILKTCGDTEKEICRNF